MQCTRAHVTLVQCACAVSDRDRNVDRYRDRNVDRYRDSAGIGQFLPVPGLTGTGIGDKTESAGIRQELTFRHRNVTRIQYVA